MAALHLARAGDAVAEDDADTHADETDADGGVEDGADKNVNAWAAADSEADAGMKGEVDAGTEPYGAADADAEAETGLVNGCPFVGAGEAASSAA